jgi:glycosyltransferase involved in cell wall biosynthesis
MKILHLTPHLGGGVGTVVRGYLGHVQSAGSDTHSVLALDTLNLESRQFLSRIGCAWTDEAFNKIDHIDALIAGADVVLVHWWNHPQLQMLLMTHNLPACRLLLWAHISGIPSPNNFTDFITSYSDRLVFTTPLSFHAPEIRALPALQRASIMTIWSTAGVAPLKLRLEERQRGRLKCHPGEVGYTGNLDYTKLNSQFLKACSRLAADGAHFTVIGPLTQAFRQDFEASGLQSLMDVTGFVDEDTKFSRMANFRVFGYPLARHHYGTCDQTIQEAQALGVPPVVLNNPMESHMVVHGQTGLVACDIGEYCKYVALLLTDDAVHANLSQNAARFAHDEYTIESMAAKWQAAFAAVMAVEKSQKSSLAKKTGLTLSPADVFIASLGHHSGVFEAHRSAATQAEKERAEAQISCLRALDNWSSPTKSTATHYCQFFPHDPWLSKWSALTLRSGE